RRQLEEAVTETPEASIAVTISIGVALLYGHSIDSVQEAADKALYQAKHNGRNQVSLAQ
ncbi:MAG: diguanylate cyclase, partial [Gammaproteobacteria bacterium]|nr:diguanylate cyclase [Gammaproteobacteria bacterium]